jgi:predicted phosphoribosyltransferase
MVSFLKGAKLSDIVSGLKDGSAFQLQLKDRASAGRVLAMILKGIVKKKKDNDVLILGIPRGGVIVADVVADKLAAEHFDIVIPRKLRAPNNKENSIGAISQDGSIVYLDEFMVESLKVSQEYIEQEKQEQLQEIARRTALYRPISSKKEKEKEGEKGEEIEADKGQAYPITSHKTIVVLIDDGIASGATVIAAAKWIRAKYKPAQLIIAAPVASRQAVELLKKEAVADVIETVTTPSNFVSVNQFYKDFDQVIDERVIEILKKRGESITS